MRQDSQSFTVAGGLKRHGVVFGRGNERFAGTRAKPGAPPSCGVAGSSSRATTLAASRFLCGYLLECPGAGAPASPHELSSRSSSSAPCLRDFLTPNGSRPSFTSVLLAHQPPRNSTTIEATDATTPIPTNTIVKMPSARTARLSAFRRLFHGENREYRISQ